MAAASVIVLVLGVVGFTRYQEAAGVVEPLATRFYQSLQLFVLESGSVSGDIPWELQFARFAAPIVAAYAILRAAATVFRGQIDLLRLRMIRDHVVVAGLGRGGSALVYALLERGERVVAIEADAGSSALRAVREAGGFVVVGDARSAATQMHARVAHARQLVAVCGDDGTNVEIATEARNQVDRRRSSRLYCVVRLASPELALLLCLEELERYGQAPVRIDFVNVHAVAAQALLRACPPFAQPDDTPRPVAVIGAGPTARHLLPFLAQAWASLQPPEAGRLAVRVFGPEPGALATLEHSHPELAGLTEVAVAADLSSAIAEPVPATVYVCPDDDEQAAACALELRRLLAGNPTRIIAALVERAGVGRLLAGVRGSAGDPTLVVFGLLDEAWRPDVMLAGTTEILAQALHAAYVEAAGTDARPDDPALRPWEDLSESLRESNRDQAAHIAVKLAAIGQAVGPLVDWGAARRPVPEPEVEVMARLEHDRWVDERQRAGWRAGPRDPLRRTTPYLVPWEDLSEEVRDKDRLFVRRLPGLLASVGLQAVRRDVTATAP